MKDRKSFDFRKVVLSMFKVPLVFSKIQSFVFVKAVRQGLIMILPILMTGSLALIFRSLPIPVYQEFINKFASGLIYSMFDLIYNATFGTLSVYMAGAIGYAVARDYKQGTAGIHGAPMVSISAFLISVGCLSPSFEIRSLSTVGMFSAIICGTLASYLYICFGRHLSRRRLFSDGSDPAFNRSLSSITPAALVLLFFGLSDALIDVIFQVPSFWHLVVKLFYLLFSHLGNNFGGGLIYILLSSILWFFGIHGSDVLESVNQSIFIPASQLNEAAALSGAAPTVLYTKTFFDVFVLIGGCGTLLSLLIAILLFSRRKSNRPHAGMASFPMLFNINELMVFGLPIIYNPIMLAPFILAPLASFLIASAAMAAGIVPLTCHAVEWTTPIFLGGWQATGSIAGALLQLINLAVGVVIYLPFVRLYDRTNEEEALHDIYDLLSILKECEKQNRSVILTELNGVPGDIAKMLVNDLTLAIQKHEPYLLYQPQYGNDGRICGAEALLRWNHKVFGMVYPSLIIKLADEAGCLTELEKYVFCKTKEDMFRRDSGIRISINSTATSIRNPDFIEFLIREFPGAHIGNTNICIEITEQSELITDTSISKVFASLKNHGFLLAIDDFSMGFTSLKYLSENRFDLVKLDGTLAKGLDNPRNIDIIDSIVYLSQSLDFSVLAEYVETTEQRDKLEKIGCKEYQGYLYSPAIPFDKLVETIENERESVMQI